MWRLNLQSKWIIFFQHKWFQLMLKNCTENKWCPWWLVALSLFRQKALFHNHVCHIPKCNRRRCPNKQQVCNHMHLDTVNMCLVCVIVSIWRLANLMFNIGNEYLKCINYNLFESFGVPCILYCRYQLFILPAA